MSCYRFIPSAPPPPADMSRRPPTEPSYRPDADDQALAQGWLAHVEAGRIGGTTPVNEEARAIILANERLMRGDRPSPIG